MKRVLVVEDSKTCAAIMTAQLEQVFGGAEVDGTDDAQCALLRLDTVDYDLLVLDLMLPGSPPDKTLRDFSPYMRRLPTVIVSGMRNLSGDKGPCDAELLEAAESAGANCVIPKGELSLTFLRYAVRLAFVEHKLEEMAKVAGVL